MKFLNCIPRRKSWTHQNTQATTEKSLFLNDLVNAPDRIQSKIANHWTDGRHHGISPIYLSQSYYDVPQEDQVKLFAHDSFIPQRQKSMWI